VLTLLNRLFQLKPGESKQFFALFAIFFLFSTGLLWASNTLRAEIVLVSSNLLSIAQQVSSVAVIGVSTLYTIFVDRVSKSKMFIGMSAISALAVLALALPLAFEDSTYRVTNYVLLWIIYQLLFYLWVIHWGTYIIDLYDTLTAKRIFPLLGAARPLGQMVAGGLVVPLTTLLHFDTLQFVIVWGVLMGIVAVLLLIVSIKRPSPPIVYFSKDSTSLFGGLLDGFRYTTGSAFMRWMAISALLLIAINTISEYQTSVIFKESFANSSDPVADFRNYTGQLEGIGNLVALVIQLFVFNALMNRIGMGNMNLVYPLLVFAVSGGVTAAPMLLTASLVWINVNAFRRILRDPIVGLMGNATPAHAKGRVRAVINGLISPIGTLLASSLQQAFQLGGSVVISILLTLFAALYFISAVILRRKYASAMVGILQDGSFSFLFSQDPDAQEFQIQDRAGLDHLRQEFERAEQADLKLFLGQLLIETDAKYAALPLITAELVDLFIHNDLKGTVYRRLYHELLHDPDPAIRRRGLQGLEIALGSKNRDYLKLAHHALNDPDVWVLEQALPALLNSSRYRSDAENIFSRLRNDIAKDQLIVAIHVHQRLGQVHDLVGYIDAPDEEVRYETITALRALWKPRLESVLRPYIASLCQDTSVEVRIAKLELLARMDESETYSYFASSLADSNSRIRQLAMDTLIGVGRHAVPYLEPLLASDNRRQVQVTLQVLYRIDPAEYKEPFEHLIRQHLSGIYTDYFYLSLLQAYESFPSVAIFNQTLRDEIRGLLDDIFDLLSSASDTESINVIRETLQGNSPRAKADALEALEAFTSPQTAREMAPLFRDISLVELAAHHQPESPMDAFQTIYNLALHGDTWVRSIMLFGLGEIGAAHPDRDLYVQGGDHEEQPIKDAPAIVSFDMPSILTALRASRAHGGAEIRSAARAAMRILVGTTALDEALSKPEVEVLSPVERVILLKRVSIFRDVSIHHMKALATICEERLFRKGEVIFHQGDAGGTLYIVVEGKVHIGIEPQTPSDSFTLLTVQEASSFFGEMTLFNGGERTASALAGTDVLMLSLTNKALVVLMRQYPEISIEMLQVLSKHLQNATTRIRDLVNTSNRGNGL
jgi:HEAT repeat protein